MGSNRYKVSYSCDCDEDWGSCGKKSYWLFSEHRGSDTWSLWHRHGDEPLEFITSGAHAKMQALLRVMDIDIFADNNGNEPWEQRDKDEGAF